MKISWSFKLELEKGICRFFSQTKRNEPHHSPTTTRDSNFFRSPASRSLQPRELFCFTNAYRAVAASGGENDIEATASFVEGETGWVDLAQDRATAVKVEITPLDGRDDREHRHLLGILERVQINTSPMPVEVLLEDGWTENDSFGAKMYQCPQHATCGGLSLRKGGCVYHPDVRVIEPNGVVCHSAQVRAFPIADGLAGGIGILLDLVIAPETVSFSGLALMEEPSFEGIRSGYFTNEIFDVSQSHTEDNGAGVWYNISPDNYNNGEWGRASLTRRVVSVRVAAWHDALQSDAA